MFRVTFVTDLWKWGNIWGNKIPTTLLRLGCLCETGASP